MAKGTLGLGQLWGQGQGDRGAGTGTRATSHADLPCQQEQGVPRQGNSGQGAVDLPGNQSLRDTQAFPQIAVEPNVPGISHHQGKAITGVP